jgi:uncharacterized protein
MSSRARDGSPAAHPPADWTRSPRTQRFHPGGILREDFLPDYGLDACDLADRLCLPVEHITSLIAEEIPVDADISLRLSRLFGNSAQFWMNLQRETDLADARGRMRPELMRVRPLSDTGWETSRSADTEDLARWLRRTSPAGLLDAELARDTSIPTTQLAARSGIATERIEALAAGTTRFTLEDDSALSAAFGVSPGYWLRGQVAADAAAGIDTSIPELSVQECIRDALCRIELDEEVRVLYAVESGSRAWGFASADSDYDVRFVYAHRPEWYVSVQRRRDVIERPLDRDLDVSGWDLPKALGLFGKSNPPLLEWLRSPIVYLETGSLAERVRELAERFASPSACLHHYRHMAENNHREYLQGERVWLKKYFYVLRPVLACRWIEAHRTLPPVEFETLAEDRLPESLKQAVDDLLRRKRAGEELTVGPRIPAVSDFLDAELRRLAQVTRPPGRGELPDREELDALLREILRETWASRI